jgi:hypothetical protein
MIKQEHCLVHSLRELKIDNNIIEQIEQTLTGIKVSKAELDKIGKDFNLRFNIKSLYDPKAHGKKEL